MATVFEMIIEGKIPGRFVWADEQCAAFLTIEPVTAGHSLVVPRNPEPKWTDLSADSFGHLMAVAQEIGRAQERAFDVPRSAVIIAGFEVPHTHVHVIPARTEADCRLINAVPADDADLDRAAEKLRGALIAEGHGKHVPHEVASPNTGG